MRPDRKLTRRSFVRRVLGGSIAAGGALALIGGEAHAQVTDSDPNDPAGQGRGGGGVTDSDSGPAADPAGRGRGGGRPTGDSDPTDRAGNAHWPDRREYADIHGRWVGSNGITYDFVQDGNRFSWVREDTGERGFGEVTTYSAVAEWEGPDGHDAARGQLLSEYGQVYEIRWNNGVVLRRP